MKVAPRRLRQPSYCSGKQVQVPRSALADEGGGDASTLKRCVRRRTRACPGRAGATRAACMRARSGRTLRVTEKELHRVRASTGRAGAGSAAHPKCATCNTAAHWRARARQATRMRTRCHAHVTCQVKLPCRPPATVSHTVERPQSVLVGRGRARGSRHAAGLGSGPAGGQSCARGGAHGSQAKGCSPRSSRLRAAGRGGSSAAPPGAAPPAPPPPAALLGPAAADRPSFGAPAAGRGGSCMGSPGPPGALCPAAP